MRCLYGNLLMAVALLCAVGVALSSCTQPAVCAADHDGDPGTSCDEADVISDSPPPPPSMGGGTGEGGSGGSGYDGSCADDLSCPPGMYCEPYNVGTDGPVPCSSFMAKCVSAEAECSDTYNPVCTCGGFIADNICKGRQAGFDWAPTSRCGTPPGRFRCGPSGYCERGIEYCKEFTIGGGTSVEHGGWCEPLPAACETIDGCACLDEVSCDEGSGFISQECTGNSNIGLTVECVW